MRVSLVNFKSARRPPNTPLHGDPWRWLYILVIHIVCISSLGHTSSSSFADQTVTAGKDFSAPAKNLISLIDSRQTFIQDILANSPQHAFEFTSRKYSNYTLIEFILDESKQKNPIIYAVANENTIIQLDMHSLRLIGVYRPIDLEKECQISEKQNCNMNININTLRKIHFNQDKYSFILLCYVIYSSMPQLSEQCYFKKISNLSKTLYQWNENNRQFKKFPIVLINSEGREAFIGQYLDRRVQIVKKEIHLQEKQVKKKLETPKPLFYFQESAEILYGFQTDDTVYFVATEIFSSEDPHKRLNSKYSNNVYVTQLVRICKHDLGGIPSITNDKFGTTAKTELVCTTDSRLDDNDNDKDDVVSKNTSTPFRFNKASSAFWDVNSQSLFVTFTTQRNAPLASAVCVYNKAEIDSAFNGQIMTPILKNQREGTPKKNPIPNVCFKLAMYRTNLSKPEKEKAKSLASDGLYRMDLIYPKHRLGALMAINDVKWQAIITYSIPASREFTANYSDSHKNNALQHLIFTRSKNMIYQFFESAPNKVCLYNIINMKIDETINDWKLIQEFLIISTNLRIIKLPIHQCQLHYTRNDCTTSLNSLCSWDTLTNTCGIRPAVISDRHILSVSCSEHAWKTSPMKTYMPVLNGLLEKGNFIGKNETCRLIVDVDHSNASRNCYCENSSTFPFRIYVKECPGNLNVLNHNLTLAGFFSFHVAIFVSLPSLLSIILFIIILRMKKQQLQQKKNYENEEIDQIYRNCRHTCHQHGYSRPPENGYHQGDDLCHKNHTHVIKSNETLGAMKASSKPAETIYDEMLPFEGNKKHQFTEKFHEESPKKLQIPICSKDDNQIPNLMSSYSLKSSVSSESSNAHLNNRTAQITNLANSPSIGHFSLPSGQSDLLLKSPANENLIILSDSRINSTDSTDPRGPTASTRLSPQINMNNTSKLLMNRRVEDSTDLLLLNSSISLSNDDRSPVLNNYLNVSAAAATWTGIDVSNVNSERHTYL